MSLSPFVADITRTDFEARVLAQSHTLPVLVDFWAGWCAPCRALKPLLEKLAGEYGGRFFLAKVDTDAEQELAAKHGVRSLPTVKLFRNGQAVDEFMGALPESRVRAFLDRHLPRASDSLVTSAIEVEAADDPVRAIGMLREALAADPDSDRAKLALARLLLEGHPIPPPSHQAEAAELLGSLSSDARDGRQAAAVRGHLALLHLLEDAPPALTLERRLAANSEDQEARLLLGTRQILAGGCEAGMENLLEVTRHNRRLRDDGARKALLACFEMLGAQDERVKKYRPLLSRALY